MFSQELLNQFNRGGIIAYPTEAMYGLGCDPDNLQALQKLIELKQRDPAKGVLVIAASYEQLLPYIDELALADKKALVLSKWPGQHTWVLPKSDRVQPMLSGEFNTIAARVPGFEYLRQLCHFLGKPIVSTSANLAGEQPCINATEVKKVFGDKVSAVVEGDIQGAKSASPIFDAITGQQYR
ncbi:Sua5/YciO/YrdC/YwlC family protein [Paraferrimonas sp. SM1919]|uniref:Sua5/YciO/YrdC/YwlC family protein n=1 Tax=Paraferrimonas sp. SM1919 TaxID=2662263 RepID=UPI0013D545BF|nr:Sua5/YciO/YrdC/YwlC family protein [Paraferrimonas sp. SM1919]